MELKLKPIVGVDEATQKRALAFIVRVKGHHGMKHEKAIAHLEAKLAASITNGSCIIVKAVEEIFKYHLQQNWMTRQVEGSVYIVHEEIETMDQDTTEFLSFNDNDGDTIFQIEGYYPEDKEVFCALQELIDDVVRKHK